MLASHYIFQGHIDKGEVVDLGDVLTKLTFDIILHSAFDAQFCTQRDLSGSTSVGATYLRVHDQHVKIIWEGMWNPFKKYYFWSGDQSKDQQAKLYKQEMIKKMLQEYRAKHGDEVGIAPIVGHTNI